MQGEQQEADCSQAPQKPKHSGDTIAPKKNGGDSRAGNACGCCGGTRQVADHVERNAGIHQIRSLHGFHQPFAGPIDQCDPQDLPCFGAA
ncbi:hypothetical protein D9M69_564960 [compost metagenome]